MGRDVTLRQLEYLVAVADLGSLSAAARATHVSTTGIAAALNDLEQSLGTTLTLRRRSKGVALTPAGRTAVHHARDLLRRSRQLADAVDHRAGRMRGPLSVGCFTTLAPWAVPALMERFLQEYPEVELAVSEADSPHLIEDLRTGVCDMAVLFAAHLSVQGDLVRADGHLLSSDGTLSVHPLHEARPRVLLHAGHELAGLDSIRLEQLDGSPGILLDVDPVRQILTGVLDRAGLGHAVRWISPSVNTVRNVVGRGLAWSILVGMGASGHSPDGRPLVSLPIDDDLPPNGVVAASLAAAERGPKIREALAALRGDTGTP